MKILVMLIGAGATGKSTLTRTLLADGNEVLAELTVVQKGELRSVRVIYTIGETMAIAGSYKRGSDDIGSMDALRQIIDLCWAQRDVVITDSVRCTQKLVSWVDEHPLGPAAVFVYLSPSLRANLKRLGGRRAERGVNETHLPERTFWNVFKFRARALSVWKFAQSQYWRHPVRFVEIGDEGTEEAATRVLNALRELQRT